MDAPGTILPSTQRCSNSNDDGNNDDGGGDGCHFVCYSVYRPPPPPNRRCRRGQPPPALPRTTSSLHTLSISLLWLSPSPPTIHCEESAGLTDSHGSLNQTMPATDQQLQQSKFGIGNQPEGIASVASKTKSVHLSICDAWLEKWEVSISVPLSLRDYTNLPLPQVVPKCH